MEYFIWYVIHDNEDDKVVCYKVNEAVKSVYGLDKIDINKRGGIIYLCHGKMTRFQNARVVRMMCFIDEKASKEEFGTDFDRVGRRKYKVFLGKESSAAFYLNPEKMELVDWNDYNENYEEYHKEYVKKYNVEDEN